MIKILQAAFLGAVVAMSGINSPARQMRQSSAPESPECTRWVDSVMSTLSPRQRVAQLFVPRLDVSDTPAGHAALRKMVSSNEVGGILLGKGTVDGYASLIAGAQAAAAIPLLVTLDGEWGLAMRVTDAPRFPYNMGLGAIADDRLLYEYGREVARECRETGIHVNFAPVLDVNSNPSNPVIGYRSFGENPVRVGRLGTAYSRGLEDGGVLSVAKHFPGHGDTSTDSHKTLPTVDHTAEKFREVDLEPFRQYIDAGLSGIMVGHLRVPALDPSGVPASLSKVVTTGLLKDEMGFDGLVFTDALAMKGAVARQGENNCVEALQAGADVVLQPSQPAADIAAVCAAIEAGKLSQEQIDRSCRKMLRYKYRLGLSEKPAAPAPGVKKRVNSAMATAVKERLAAASITVVRNDDGLLPMQKLGSRTIAVVSIGAPANNLFAEYCLKYARCENFSVTSADIPASVLSAVKKADVVIVGVMTDAQWARTVYSRFADHPDMVGVFFVNPYKMGKFGSLLRRQPTLVAAYDDTPELRKYAAQALFGGIDVTGVFPVNVANVADEGSGVTLLKNRLGYFSPIAAGMDNDMVRRIDSIARVGVREKAFPGCQVVVARKGKVVLDKSYGKIESGGTSDVTDETLYDIASMTKATATLGGLMKAYDEGLFGLDDRLSAYVPGLDRADKKDLRVKEFLFHETGMPAIISIQNIMMDPASYEGALVRAKNIAPHTVKIARGAYGNSKARMRRDIIGTSLTDANPVEIAEGIYGGDALRDTVMARIYEVKLRPSKSYRYSCLNFCLLMEMEENLTGVAHDQWVETELFGPLGAWHTGFRPREYYPVEKIAPTENDPFLRRQLVRGYVHDEIAAFSGGVQGNAGLFSTASDIAKYSQMLLNRGEYGGERFFAESTVKTFTNARSRGGKRALGFDLASGLKSLSETGASASTYGHTGFTGTCFWIDPVNEVVFVFLSNRVNPSRDNAAFTRLNPRGEMLRAVYEAIR